MMKRDGSTSDETMINTFPRVIPIKIAHHLDGNSLNYDAFLHNVSVDALTLQQENRKKAFSLIVPINKRIHCHRSKLGKKGGKNDNSRSVDQKPEPEVGKKRLASQADLSEEYIDKGYNLRVRTN